MPDIYKPNLLTLVAIVCFIAVGGMMVADAPGERRRFTYLALGDSYTVGTNERYNNNYPNQVVRLLREQKVDIGDAVIVAHAGWTTGKLIKAIEQRQLRDTFSFVSLLIGANNQISGMSASEFKAEFEVLLQTAIRFANGNRMKVFVLSIPDWSATPFAWYYDRPLMSKEVAEYNAVCREVSTKYHCNFQDITSQSREWAKQAAYLASDSMHYSAKGYAVWAEQLAGRMQSGISP
jgi:lysophospholipase L1-like esterase